MKYRFAVIFVLIVCLPLAMAGWLGMRLAANEREVVRHRVGALLVDRLRSLDGSIAVLMASHERDLMDGPPLSSLSIDALREMTRGSAVVRQYFVLDPNSEPVFPPPDGALTADELEFLERTRHVWANREIPGAAKTEISPPVSNGGKGGKGGKSFYPSKGGKGMEQAPVVPQRGWHVRYWDKGLNVMFWWRDSLGAVVGAELNPVRLTADIVALLPVTDASAPAGSLDRTVLSGPNGETLYQWGLYEPRGNEAPQATLALSAPLGAWKLTYYAPETLSGYGSSAWFNILAGLAAVFAAVMSMAGYFYWHYAREMREASQRISFVNQVSHELKTPLTSIRMYAEMLGDELDDTHETPRRYLDIIVSESQRLSRLIGNVLTFSRKQRSALTLHTAPGGLDDTLRALVDHFKEPLAAKGIEAVFNPRAPEPAEFDADAIQQIVGNLLNNVEKYAVSADRVEVVTKQDGDTVTITVADNGPGIPPRERERIFMPFYRVSNRLTDGVAGTGIGLSIARDLAQLHGGGLTLEPSAKGAAFKATLHCPRVRKEDES